MNTSYPVVKLSGKALSDTQALGRLFASLKEAPAVVVHGGGVEVDALFKALGVKVEKKDGLRVSPASQMPLISAALCGQCNKKVQSLAIAAGLDAVGLLCSDGGTLGVTMAGGDLGFVGVPHEGSPAFLMALLGMGVTPVVCSLAFDAAGQMYNINADDAASELACMLKAPIYYISDVPGVLSKDKSLIEEIDSKKAAALIADGTISGGMAVKVRSALKASERSGQAVCIGSIADPGLSTAIAARRRLGTAVSV
ncbi:MAG: acetylglutamate kinase [Succinivibrio sp.]